MSPELFYPENFGLKDSRPTKYSDCYALGMVIYEVLSGQVPFPRYNICAVVAKVSRGERPGRPRGAEKKWFTDRVWRTLQGCWAPKRDHRPRIEDVLRCLEEASRFWTPIPRKAGDSSTTNSSTPNSSDPATDGTTGDSGASSPSRVATSESAPPFNESVKSPEHDVGEIVVEMGGELACGPLGRVDSASPLSSPDWDGSILEAEYSSLEEDETSDENAGIFASVPIPDFQPLQTWQPPSVDESPSQTSPIVFTMQPSSSYNYTAKSSPPTYRPAAPPKSANITIPATRRQRGGRKLRPRGRIQPASPRQSDLLLQPWPVRSLALSSTIVEPPSSSHEYNSDTSSSTIGPAVPPKPTRMPIPRISKRRGTRKSPRNSLPRDYGQPTSPRKSELSLRASPGGSLALLSTLVEPPSSLYAYETSLQTPRRKSLALSSTYSEPPSSPPKYDSDSSSSTHSPVTPRKPVNVSIPAIPKQRGGTKPRPRGIIWDHTQPASLGKSNLLTPSPPVKSLALLSTLVEPSSSHHEYEADSSSSTPYLVVSPFGSPPGRTMLEREGREPHHDPLRSRPKFVAPRRRPSSQLQIKSATSPYPLSSKPQTLRMENLAGMVSHGDARGLSTSGARRGRFGNRTWKSLLRSSLGKLLGNPATPS